MRIVASMAVLWVLSAPAQAQITAWQLLTIACKELSQTEELVGTAAKRGFYDGQLTYERLRTAKQCWQDIITHRDVVVYKRTYPEVEFEPAELHKVAVVEVTTLERRLFFGTINWFLRR